MTIKSLIRTIPDYPKKGIMFRDITTLIQDPVGLRLVVNQLLEKLKGIEFDVIVGIEARGFIIGAAMAYASEKGFVPIRKKGKLPGKTISQDYQLEYGVDTLEIHTDSLKEDQKVLIVDDLLATGGTILCAIQLVEELKAKVVHTAFVVDLPELNGKDRIKDNGYSYTALVEFDGH